MEWNRYKNSALKIWIKSGVIEAGLQELREFMGEVNLPAVFEVMKQRYPDTISMQGCTGKFEVEIEIITVGAPEVRSDFSVITITAQLAKRGFGVVK